MGTTHRQAFTLVELLVVMAIIGILTALTLGAAKVVQDKSARSRAQGEVAAIELALERYKIDNGDYPSVSTIPISSSVYNGKLGDSSVLDNYEGEDPTVNGSTGAISGGSGGRLLFAELMGRTRLTATSGTGSKGTTLTADNRAQYIELKANQVNKSTSGANYIKDPWNFPYGYYYKYDGIDPAATTPDLRKSLFNEVVPDFWSTSGETDTAGPTGSGDQKARYMRWTTNWPNK